MLDAVVAWVRQLVFLALFAAFFELLLPSGALQKFIRVIVGLLIMLAVLRPAADFFAAYLSGGAAPVLCTLPADARVQADAAAAEKTVRAVYKRELERQLEAAVDAVQGVAAVRGEVLLEEDVDGRAAQVRKVVLHIWPEAAGAAQDIRIDLREKREAAELNAQTANKIKQMVCALYQLAPEAVEMHAERGT